MINLYLNEKKERESALQPQSKEAENSHLVDKKQDNRIKNSAPEYQEHLLTTESNAKDEVNDTLLTVQKS